ncbi:MAG: hypothetical protein K9L85_01730 [Candidatus Peribacteraceae bacterium]|nr:hypothetical protein [Candidatus Peribacteraceae bacterium]
MAQNKTDYGIFFEKRPLWKTVGAEGLRTAIKLAGEDIHPDEVSKKTFENKQDKDKSNPDDTHEKSKTALEKLAAQEKVKKLTKEQLDQLKKEITEASQMDTDATLETSEIKHIETAIDKLPAETEDPLQLSQLKRPEGQEWMDSKNTDKKGKNYRNARDFFNNLIDKNIDGQGDELKKGVAEANVLLSQLGLSIDEQIIREAYTEKIVQLNTVKSFDIDDLAEASKSFEGNWNPLQRLRMWHNNISEIKTALGQVRTELNEKIKTIKAALKEAKFDPKKSQIDVKGLLTQVGKAHGIELFKGDKITSQFIFDYLLRGGDLIGDMKKIAIKQEWTKLKPKIEAFRGKLEITGEKELLQGLADKDLSGIEELRTNMNKLFEVWTSLDKGLLDNAGNKEKLLGHLGFLKAGKIDLNELSVNKIQEIQEKSEKLIKKIKSLEEISKNTFETVNAKLAQFGGNFDVHQLSSKIFNKILNQVDVVAIFEDPDSLDKAILENIKENFSLSEITKVEEIPTKLSEAIDNFLGTLEKRLIEKLSGDLEIDGIKIKLKEEDLNKILPKVKKQILPMLSDFFATDPKYEAEGLHMIKDGNLDLEVFKKIMGSAEMTKVINFAKRNKGDVTKISAEIKEDGKKEGSDAKAIMDLTEKIGKFAIDDKNPTPAIKAIQDEITSIVPFETKIKIGAERLKENFSKAIDLVREKGFLGALGEIIALIIPTFTKLFSSLSKWWGDMKEKYVKPVIKEVKKHSPEIAKKIEETTGAHEETPEEKAAKTEKAVDQFIGKDVNAKGLNAISMQELFAAEDDTALEALGKKPSVGWTKENLKKLKDQLNSKFETNDPIRTDTNKKVFTAIQEKPELLK